jgi:putative ABC transport system substrate-binding protein
MSYGASLAGAWFEAGLYAAMILRGASPSAIPVKQPSQVEFALNLATARALGLNVSQQLLARVDYAVE